MNKKHLLLMLCGALLFVGLGQAIFLSVGNPVSAPGPLLYEKTIIIRPNTPLLSVSRQLESHGIISNRWIFSFYAWYEGHERKLRAGEYRFPAKSPLNKVLEDLSSGNTLHHSLTIPEGLTSQEILAELKTHPLLAGELEELPAEGSLLPETYFFSRQDARSDILKRMQTAMNKAISKLWETRPSSLPFKTPEEAITLASIVEKEARLTEERPHIAAVFLNRLEKGMPLMADPTVVYGLAQQNGPLNRPLNRKDLSISTTYNTYLQKGLPPTPICNPGLASLKAVFQPKETEDLYFVADGEGGHIFSNTYKEHMKYHNRLRKLRKEIQKRP